MLLLLLRLPLLLLLLLLIIIIIIIIMIIIISPRPGNTGLMFTGLNTGEIVSSSSGEGSSLASVGNPSRDGVSIKI